MVKYKRLTVKLSDGEPTVKCRITIQALINCLAKLEDKIESGELREVPRGAVVLTPEEWEEEMKAAREGRIEFERRIGLLNNELNKGLFGHKAFVEKTAIEVGRLKAEKAQAVKEFAGKLKEKFYYVFGYEYEQSVSGFDTKVLIEHINETLKEYEK